MDEAILAFTGSKGHCWPCSQRGSQRWSPCSHLSLWLCTPLYRPGDLTSLSQLNFSVIVSFSAAVIKYPDKNNLREKWFILIRSSRGTESTVVEKAWQQSGEAWQQKQALANHIFIPKRKQDERTGNEEKDRGSQSPAAMMSCPQRGFSSRFHNLAKQLSQLETKCSNTCASRAHFSFNPLQWSIKNY